MVDLNPNLRALLREYAAATKAQEAAQRQAEELGAQRAQLLARMTETGLSQRQLAAVLTAVGLPISAARVQALIGRTTTKKEGDHP